jgi:glycosyltransferase involved in cell wall biosynthesis
MPVYNAERYLAKAVESILEQTWTDFEFIIINDGSTDSSLQILQQFAEMDRRIRLISRENRGLVATLNEGIELARAPWVARMDADDIALTQRFEAQLHFLSHNPDHVVVGSWVETMNEQGQPISVIQSPTLHSEIDNKHLSGHTSICHPSAVIKRSALLRIHGYDPKMEGAEDLDVWLQLAEFGKLANVPSTLFRYRLHSSSISGSKQSLQKKLMRLSCQRAWARRKIKWSFDAEAGDWRPTDDPASQHRYALEYGWQAWNHGFKNTWWTYAKQAIRLKPFAPASWKLLLFGFIKTPH